MLPRRAGPAQRRPLRPSSAREGPVASRWGFASANRELAAASARQGLYWLSHLIGQCRHASRFTLIGAEQQGDQYTTLSWLLDLTVLAGTVIDA